MTADLLAFLRARLDEDEVAAAGASPGPWRPWRGEPGLGLPTLEHSVITGDQLGVAGELALIATASWMDTEHIARHDPAREMREVEAKRRILEQCEHSLSWKRPVPPDKRGEWALASLIVDFLALPYADHPDYRTEWTP